MLTRLDVSYDTFKKMIAKTNLVALTTYYEDPGGAWTHIFCAHQDQIFEAVAASTNITHFNANYKAGATAGSSSDDAYARALDAALPDGTATLSNVAASASNVTLLAANTRRRRVIIENDSGSTLKLKYGTTASGTSLTRILIASASFELPVSSGLGRIYPGRIDGIWLVATGSARITEET